MQAAAIPVAEGDIHAAVPNFLSHTLKRGRHVRLTTSSSYVSRLSRQYESLLLLQDYRNRLRDVIAIHYSGEELQSHQCGNQQVP
jgi:hypothetical protein